MLYLVILSMGLLYFSFVSLMDYLLTKWNFVSGALDCLLTKLNFVSGAFRLSRDAQIVP